MAHCVGGLWGGATGQQTSVLGKDDMRLLGGRDNACPDLGLIRGQTYLLPNCPAAPPQFPPQSHTTGTPNLLHLIDGGRQVWLKSLLGHLLAV